MAQEPSFFERKIVAPDALALRIAGLPRPLVFTNGVFDLLHRGHVTYLARARAMAGAGGAGGAGGALLVALNSDASARRLGKGADRPINPLEDRLAVLAALESVDVVSWFEDDTPAELIRLCRPDVLVKGGDWPVERIVGAQEVLAWGGSVRSIAFEHERSTTRLVRQIRGL